MVICRDCGTRNPSGVLYCHHCSGDLYARRHQRRDADRPTDVMSGLLARFVRVLG